MGGEEVEKYIRNIMTRCKNQFSKGKGGKETPDTCACYPEGLEQSDATSAHRSPAGMEDLEGKVTVPEEAVESAGSERGGAV